MRRSVAIVVSFALIVYALPFPICAASSGTQMISTHGSKTYMGTYSAWNESSWGSDNFTEVTGKNIKCSDDLIIKAGKIGNVTMGDGASLTISGGLMEDVSSEEIIDMTAGTANSLKSDTDISISGGTVKKSVIADETVDLSDKIAISGGISAKDVKITATSSSGSTSVTNEILFTGSMVLTGNKCRLSKINGKGSGTLELSGFSGNLPAISNIVSISVDSNSRATANGNIDVNTLSLSGGGKLITTSAITVGTITGAGTLKFTAGNLTIKNGIWNYPDFELNCATTDGTIVFKAISGTVAANDVTLNGYSLTKKASISNSDYDDFIMNASTSNAASSDIPYTSVSLDTTSASIPIGCTYYVLAITDSNTPPAQMSYNSAIAVVGQAKAYNYNGKIGWLYSVKAVTKGGVTIDIGGQKMFVVVT
jgi:hypothetical protein